MTGARDGGSVGWLAVGLALTTATRLRMGGMPLGPGELMLAAWALVVIGQALFRGRVARSAIGGGLVALWLAFLALMSCGWVVAYLTGRQDPMALHDFPAFLFATVLVAALTVPAGGLERVRRAAPALMAVTVLPLVAMLALLPVTTHVGPVLFWVGRFQGWALNANAIALAVAPVPFVTLHLLRSRTDTRARRLRRLVMLGAIAVGIATLSDALFLAWGASGGLLALVRVRELYRRRWHGFGRAAVVYVLLPLLALGALAALGGRLAMTATSVAENMYGGDSNQGGVRLTLWRHGLEAIATSPLVGLGPGPHAGLTGPFQGSEAHNSFIDWTASAGLLGTLLFVGYLAWVAAETLRSRRFELTAALVALVVVSVFHYVMRQPAFWYYTIYLVVESRHARPAGPALTAPAAIPAPAS